MEVQISEFMNSGNFTTLHCVGHSLGGALAALIANKYSQKGSTLQGGITLKVIKNLPLIA
jgi:pimeloyl-ACP methyl ester carboxylesterase